MLVTTKLHDMTIDVLSDRTKMKFDKCVMIEGTDAKLPLAGPISAEFF